MPTQDADLAAVLALDCGDNSCLYAGERKGMRTNGGCRCMEKLAPDVRGVKRINLERAIRATIAAHKATAERERDEAREERDEHVTIAAEFQEERDALRQECERLRGELAITQEVKRGLREDRNALRAEVAALRSQREGGQ